MNVLDAIQQRPPFLFVDKVVAHDEESIHTQKQLTGEEDFFKGHFPGNPIMPGVLLCEAVFQTGAILMSTKNSTKKLGVVSRIEKAKFKKIVRASDLLDIHVTLKDVLASAFYMAGSIKVDGKIVLTLNFSCNLVEET